MSHIKITFFVILLLLISDTPPASAQIFEREIDTIPVMINGKLSHNAFDGGFDSSKPAFADIDNDGDFDLFIGEEGGRIIFYRNQGTKEKFIFELVTKDFLSFDVGIFSFPSLVDIDEDGDFDLFVGEGNGNINYFRNDGTANEPNFTFVTSRYFSIDVGKFSLPTFIDIDNDGDFDLFVGEEDGNLNYYRNDGTAIEPNFVIVTENFFSINVDSYYSILSFVDIDGDNDLSCHLLHLQTDRNPHHYLCQ